MYVSQKMTGPMTVHGRPHHCHKGLSASLTTVVSTVPETIFKTSQHFLNLICEIFGFAYVPEESKVRHFSSPAPHLQNTREFGYNQCM